MNDAAGGRLIRGLRRGDLVALVINSVVGAGIFGLPSQVYALAGTGAWRPTRSRRSRSD